VVRELLGHSALKIEVLPIVKTKNVRD